MSIQDYRIRFYHIDGRHDTASDDQDEVWTDAQNQVQTAGKLIAGIAVNEIEDYNAESAALQELIALTKDIHIYP